MHANERLRERQLSAFREFVDAMVRIDAGPWTIPIFIKGSYQSSGHPEWVKSGRAFLGWPLEAKESGAELHWNGRMFWPVSSDGLNVSNEVMFLTTDLRVFESNYKDLDVLPLQPAELPVPSASPLQAGHNPGVIPEDFSEKLSEMVRKATALKRLI